jgi:o-succinylbenzoate synthase
MLDDLLATLRVITLPTRTNFRGVTYREVALMQGPARMGGVLTISGIRR